VLGEARIAYEPAPPYTQHKNGVAERMIRTLNIKGRSMMLDAKVSMRGSLVGGLVVGRKIAGGPGPFLWTRAHFGSLQTCSLHLDNTILFSTISG
jgi:hypothetical protein